MTDAPAAHVVAVYEAAMRWLGSRKDWEPVGELVRACAAARRAEEA